MKNGMSADSTSNVMPREGHGSRNPVGIRFPFSSKMSCPARGMGVEIGLFLLLFYCMLSCPARGMGVEIALDLSTYQGITKSCPARGRGVEIGAGY